MDLPQCPRNEFGDISASPGEEFISLLWPSDENPSSPTDSEQMKRAEEYLESQHNYASRRTAFGHSFLDPNIPPWDLPYSTETVKFYNEEASSTAFSDEVCSSDKKASTNNPNLFSASWTPWGGPDILSDLLAARREEGFATPHVSASAYHLPPNIVSIWEGPSKKLQLPTQPEVNPTDHLPTKLVPIWKGPTKNLTTQPEVKPTSHPSSSRVNISIEAAKQFPNSAHTGMKSTYHLSTNPVNIWEEAMKKLQPPNQREMKITIIPTRPVHFVSNNIQISIRVENVPMEWTVQRSMLQAVAISSNGRQFRCKIRASEPYIQNLFIGHIKLCDEPGNYEVRVRMTLPLEHWGIMEATNGGTVCSNLFIRVSRNYIQDSRTCSSFQLEFQPTAPLNTSSGYHQLYSKVWGLTCNKFRNHIYYSDRGSNKIYCVDPEGRLITSFGPFTEAGDLNRPTGLAYDHRNQRLVVSDKDNHRISFFTADGQYLSSFGEQGHLNGQFNYPWDVAVNPRNEDIAVMDSRNKRVQLFDRACNFIGKFSVFETDVFNHKKELENPRGCNFDTKGNFLYLTDYTVQNLWKFTSDLSSGRKIVQNYVVRRPQGVLVDRHENLLVADSRNNAVKILSNEGEMIASIRGVSKRFMENPINLTFLAGEEKLVLLDGDAKLHIF